MKRFFLEIQVGFLVIVGVALVLGSGYLAYKGISSIVTSIQKESEPDIKLTLIRKLASDLEKAENSVRLYAYTKQEKDLSPFFELISGIDDQFVVMRKEGENNLRFLANMDTVSSLIGKKFALWNEMIPLYAPKQSEQYLDTITKELEAKLESDSIRENRSLIKKIFKRSKKAEIDEERIIREIEEVKDEDLLVTEQIKQQELMLAKASNKLTGHFYELIEKIEEEENVLREKKSAEVQKMAEETYSWIGWFALSATISMILVIFIISRYIRKAGKYEKALIQAKNEAIELARTKELFMANVSHEVRTPMNVISGFVNQLLKKPHDKSTSETLKIIKSSSDHLVRIINDILDFSKLESGKMQLDEVHFILKNTFNEVFLLFETHALNKNIEFRFDLSEDLPQAIYGDPVRLKQILINLLGNAIKFTSEGGEVVLNVAPENHIAGHIDLLIAVKDTGVGIPEEKQKIIFEDFTQAEASTSQKFGGTGLGLSIVKKLVELHGGRIAVSSNEGEGSEFSCRIHYKTGEPDKVKKEIVEEISPADEIKGLRFLVVDDELYNRKLILSILGKWNVIFEEAENGKVALELMEKQEFDVVLMDKRMPVMDGLKTAEIISENEKNNVRVILITAETVTRKDFAKYQEMGIHAYMPKPFTEEDLIKTIQKLNIVGNIIPLNEFKKEKDPVSDKDENFDLSQLYRVAGDDESFVIEMLQKFMESFESSYIIMKDAISSGDFKKAGDYAHKLASPCRHMGAEILLKYLKEIESAVDKNPEASFLLEKSESAYNEYISVKKKIQDHIGPDNK